MRSRRCSRRSTRAASTRSGASATWSATGRSRTSAPRSCGSGPTSAWPAITIWSCSGRSRSIPFADDAGVAARWTQASWTTTHARSWDTRAAGDPAGRRALPRQPARPRLGLRAHRGRRAGELRGDHGAARTRRAQPHRARARQRRHRRSRRPGGRRARRRPRRPRGGCSTPARSASRATATRAPPGSRSTSTQAGNLPPYRYPVERTQAEMRELGLPESWPRGSSTASSSTRGNGVTWLN